MVGAGTVGLDSGGPGLLVGGLWAGCPGTESPRQPQRAGLLALTRGFLTLASDIDMLEEFAYLRTQEGGKIHLELLPNQGMLIK